MGDSNPVVRVVDTELCVWAGTDVGEKAGGDIATLAGAIVPMLWAVNVILTARQVGA